MLRIRLWMERLSLAAPVVLSLALASCSQADAPAGVQSVDDDRLRAASSDTAN